MKLVLSLAVFVCGVLVRTYGTTTTTKPGLGISGSTSTTKPRLGISGSTSTTTRGLGAYDFTRTTTPSLALSVTMAMTTVPPESDPSKYRDQNATRVVEMNATQWVKWRTYNVTDFLSSDSLQCENFRVMERITPTNYSLQYRYRSGNRWNTINETLVLKDLYERGFPNDMYFARTPLGLPTDNLVLYSNYMNCTVLRIPMQNQGGRHCDLWMANLTLSQETPDDCLNSFFEYCNTTQIFRVFYPNCTNENIHSSLE
uniref:Putative salivary lipocalin n=1 Tax=Ixodes ricinus TaxID=34613 RepID=A0A0K8R766_IXORI